MTIADHRGPPFGVGRLYASRCFRTGASRWACLSPEPRSSRRRTGRRSSRVLVAEPPGVGTLQAHPSRRSTTRSWGEAGEGKVPGGLLYHRTHLFAAASAEPRGKIMRGNRHGRALGGLQDTTCESGKRAGVVVGVAWGAQAGRVGGGSRKRPPRAGFRQESLLERGALLESGSMTDFLA